MSRILQINSSIFADQGVSSRLADRFVETFTARWPQTTVQRRDLAREPLPHLDAERFTAFGTPAAERTTAQTALVAQSDELVRELQAADVLVLGAPMYNFSVSSQLKAWFDHVARAGVTFRYTETGPQGLLEGVRGYVFTARGGVYEGADDLQTPFVRKFLGLLGITEVSFVHAQGLAMRDARRWSAVNEAEAQIQQLVCAEAA